MRKLFVILLICFIGILFTGCVSDDSVGFMLTDKLPTIEQAPYLIYLKDNNLPSGIYVLKYRINNGILEVDAIQRNMGIRHITLNQGQWTSIEVRK